jgi:uncharacterized protein (TIGR03435 family)
MVRMAFTVGVACVMAAALAAQQPAPSFQVISIKANVSRSFPAGPEVRPGGSFIAMNATLDRVVRFAFDVPDYRLTGGPDWVRSDRFDIQANAGEEVSPDQMRRMVQALLAQRFQLAIRRESRQMSIYDLLLARNDKQLGRSLRPSAPDCAAPTGPGQTLEEHRSANGGVASRRTCAPMATLVAALSSALQSPVDDKTGLTGLWDYELLFTGERRRGADPAAAARDTNEAPVLSTAIQEQLGLKFEPSRGPVEVLVIDSVERPTPD